MADLADKHTSRLEELKKSVEEAKEYFDKNIARYEKFMRFVFLTSLSDGEEAALAEQGKPSIEFNILESHISKLRGEFAKQQPSLQVRAADGVPISMMTPQFLETISLVESHLRAVFFDASNDMLDYNVYSDLLAGGFSVLRVYTKYVNEMSFEQKICAERVFDPTLTVFDPMARESHKGDGRFCAELYPMTKKQFEVEFGEDSARDMKFTRSLSGFDWSFQNEKEKIALVCDYYEKKTRRTRILKLTNGHSVTEKEYEDFLKEWSEQERIEQPPAVLKKRWTNIEYICRYRFCEGKVLDYIETDYKYLPLVFVDGNSVVMKESGSYQQVTRPYVYHAEGLQKLKNYAGQSLACNIENQVMHKFKVAIESVPEDYQEPYRNVQKADVLMYNAFHEGNPQVPLPPPQEIMQAPIPAEIPNTFGAADGMIETILGNNDPSRGVAQAPMSGIAFARSAIQTNNASVPYLVGFIKGLNRVGEIYVDLMPKYFRTPISLPTLLPNGKRAFTEINRKGSLYMNFDPCHLQVKVETGVNFSLQKEMALQTVIAMSQANQGFAAFFNEEGLPVLLDNIDIRGIDQLKAKAEGWMQKQKQMQAQQMQQQQQIQMQATQMAMQKQQIEIAGMKKELQSPSQADVEMMFIQQKAQTDAANIQIKAQDSETKFLETMAKIRGADVDRELKAAEIEAENVRTQINSVIDLSKHISEKAGESKSE